MSADQKAWLRQLQLAGLGIVIGAVGLAAHHAVLPWIGAGVFLVGLARFFLVRSLQKKIREQEDG